MVVDLALVDVGVEVSIVGVVLEEIVVLVSGRHEANLKTIFKLFSVVDKTFKVKL